MAFTPQYDWTDASVSVVAATQRASEEARKLLGTDELPGEVAIIGAMAEVFRLIEEQDVGPIVIGNFQASGDITAGGALTGATLVVTGAATLSGALSNLGIGTAPVATSALRIGVTALTGTSQYGINNTATGSAAATVALYGSYTSVTTFAGAQTTTTLYGSYIAAPTKGAGSTITNRYGLYLEAVTGGATINMTLRVGVGDVGIGIQNTSSTTGSATSKYGLQINPSYDSTTTAAAYGIYLGHTTAAAAFTLTNLYGIYVDSVAKGSGSTVTNRYGIYVVGPTDGGTLNYGIYVANGGVTVALGNIGIGTAQLATSGLTLGSTALTGTSQYGINNQIVASAAATAALYGSYTSVTTFAGAQTTTNVYGSYIASPTKGVGSTITNRYGLYIEAVVDGGTINRGIYNAGNSQFVGTVAIGSVPLAYEALAIYSLTLSGATGQYGIDIEPTFGVGATASGFTIYAKVVTAAASFTMTNAYGLYVDTLVKGATSAVTNNYGIYVNTASGGATINYGIYVAGGTPAIYVAAGGIDVIGGALGVGAAQNAAYKIGSRGTTTSSTVQAGIFIDVTHNVSATGGCYGAYVGTTTANSSFTCTNFYSAYIDAVAKGASSTITNRYGLYVVTPTDGGTLNRAVYISGATAVSESQGREMLMSGTAAPATAGAAAAGAPISLYSGLTTIEVTSDVPTHTRPKGSLCINAGGTTVNNRMYINTDGGGTWTVFTTAG